MGKRSADGAPHNTQDFDLDAALENLAHWLPTQKPIKDFIHHNTLHAVQHLPFHQGIAVAARVFGAYSYLPLSDYQERYRDGRISDSAIDWAIAQEESDLAAGKSLRASLFEPDPTLHYPPRSLASQGIRAYWLTHIEVDLNALVQPVLFRLTANFLDQGISRWTVARTGESFWACAGRLVEGSFLPLHPFSEPHARAMLAKTPEEAILDCLRKIVGTESLFAQYLLELTLAHPGWSGMVRVVETTPEALLAPRRISLKEFLALELAAELAFLHRKRGESFPKVGETPGIRQAAQLPEAGISAAVPRRLKIWHEAMEFSLHAELLGALRRSRQSAVRHPPAFRIPKAQALFCIDDRECSLRRHVEEVEPGIATYGAAGFFGIDFLFKGVDDAYAVAHCPVAVTPRHLVVESPTEPSRERTPPETSFSKLHFRPASLWKGWALTPTAGLAYAARLAFDVFRPGKMLPGIRRLGEVEAHTHLHLLRESDKPTADGRLLGFSHSEMADRVERLLRGIGLVQGFAPLVVVVAHGSSSVNNPHFAAYDCGACAGKPGAPNARALARMANDGTVRDILRERGIDIPVTTRFVPALHNTSRDEVHYLDRPLWEPDPPPGLAEFRDAMLEALRRNAAERCRWFALAPADGLPDSPLRHVQDRASSIFEPRPELNHSNNLYCIVGRRELTRPLYLDRRAFLHSYDPASDPLGVLLGGILAAVIPVCGGINLEYLFSRIDNSVYGAGSKLPHNVIGLLGVANGVEGDLRTGLPSQMIEVHEPARLLIVVEQTTAIIDAAIGGLGELREWLANHWVRLAACHPLTGETAWFDGRGWSALPPAAGEPIPAAHDSRAITADPHRTIPVHRLTQEDA
jgi:uncharacterized protein YbcC (UPF0753/DUF2309 family)